jgi:hypothetical protein
MNKHKVALLAVVILMVAALACGRTTTDKLQEAAAEPTATTEEEVEPTSEPESTEPAGDEPTEAPPVEPTKKPLTEPEALKIEKQGFGQDERDLAYAFVLTNPNPERAVEDSQYQIAAYDKDGTVVDTDSGYIQVLFPGETVGIAGTMFLDAGVTVTKLDVQILEGDPVETDPIPSFGAESVVYTPGEYSDSVTGIIVNPFEIPLQGLVVSGILYDADGEIIGAGFTYVNFVLASDSTGVELTVTSAQGTEVDSVEVYAMVSGWTMFMETEELPEGAEDINLVDFGFGQNETSLGYGFVLENPNPDFAIESTMYHLTAYAEDGHVLAVEEGYISLLLPGETLGIGGEMWLSSDTTVDRAEIQVLSGDYEESGPIPAFTSENAVYLPDDWSPQVTGQIVSPFGKDVTNLRVYAILYDADGEIIGGGSGYADFAPANGKVAVEVYVESAVEPAAVELYGSVSALSDIE